MGSVWNPENIRDVGESVGITTLSTEVVDHLTRDVEFRIAQVLEEALKFMRHAKRTTLFTQDIAQALRVLDVEPLYGYDSTRPLKFGEASIGHNHPIFYLEDEEVDFEKLINAPLPKVPREICFTAHWLAVEGVQPTIPQNPTPADSRNQDLLPRGPGANPHLAATAGADNINVKPQVKHVLSKELQLYFETVCNAVIDENNDEYRNAAISSLSTDPGLHQLVPYFVNYVAEKVTHNLKNIFILEQMMHLIDALLHNPHFYITPYVAHLVPPVLTCLVGKRLGPSSPSNTNGDGSPSMTLPPHFALRDLAAALLQTLTKKEYTTSVTNMKPRLARSFLKSLLSTTLQPMGTYYGAVIGLSSVGGAEVVRVLLIPNLKALGEVLKEALDDVTSGGSEEQQSARRKEIDAVVVAVIRALEVLEREGGGLGYQEVKEEDKEKVFDKVGEIIGEKIWSLGNKGLVGVVLAQDLPL